MLFALPMVAIPASRVVLAALLALVASGCRLPARELRWEVAGSERTWLPSMGEHREGSLAVRVWIAHRAMWPLPLPGSRTLFFGDEDLFVLILLDNLEHSDLILRPSRILLRNENSRQVRGPARIMEGCERLAPPAGHAACGVSFAARRGVKTLELDLSDAVPSSANPIVFDLKRRGAWVWPRVGPGIPGL